ncbi:hypothetical protein BHE74_00022934 [Ensete ventricosum]|nr:hypothetical protein BHE74_00022934 [Ensete ventricosum]
MRLQVRVSALPTSGRPYNRWRPHTYARLASRVGSATSAGQLFEAGRRGDRGLFAMDTEAGEEGKNASDGSPTAEREDKEQGDGSAAAPAEAGGEEGKEEEGGDEAKEKVEGEKRKRGRKRKAAADKSGEEGEGMPKEGKRRSVVVREGATSVERPSRERKTVERFSEMSLPRSPVPKTLSFKQVRRALTQVGWILKPLSFFSKRSGFSLWISGFRREA